MTKVWLALGLALGAAMLSGCVVGSAERTRFRQVSDEFVKSHYAMRPLEGVALGWHEYDGKFVVPTREVMLAERARLERFDARFREIDGTRLSQSDRLDLDLLKLVVARERWAQEVQRNWTRNPMMYAGWLDVSFYLKRDFKPLRERVADMTSILVHAPAVFAAGRTNLGVVLPKAFVETAIDVVQGTASFLEKDVLLVARKCGDPAVLGAFEKANRTAVEECRAFATWLRTERLPSADGSYAVGRAGFAEMLRSEGITMSPEEILEMGLRELKSEQARFEAAAREIDPTRTAAEVYKSIQKEHPTAAGLLEDTRKNLEAIRAFVVTKRLVTIPSEVRARVAETLPPFRSTSFASMDTPGPFETKATEAYYYITPVEPEWPAAQAEEWLSAFNYYTTDVVSIHEAYPGHYTQFLALNASKASTVQKIFPSYSFAEGWAHYTELMLIESGFMEPTDPAKATREERVKAAKYRLAQSDEALLRLCRLCCAVQLHCSDMTVDQATQFFHEQAHYEQKPARSEATRGTFDPGYLYYTLGKLQILKLREKARREQGPRFDLMRFHDELLSHGAPPIQLLEEYVVGR
jgi:uncharacterized protein (DUF885 family)